MSVLEVERKTNVGRGVSGRVLRLVGRARRVSGLVRGRGVGGHVVAGVGDLVVTVVGGDSRDVDGEEDEAKKSRTSEHREGVWGYEDREG